MSTQPPPAPVPGPNGAGGGFSKAVGALCLAAGGLAVVGLLAAIAIPNFVRAREKAGASSNEAKLYKAVQTLAKQIQAREDLFQRDAEALEAVEVLSPGDLTSQSQIADHKALVRRYIESNVKLKDCLVRRAEIFRGELVKAELPATEVDSAMQDFDRAGQAHSSLILEIRNADGRIGRAMLGALDVLDTNWGRWRYDAASGKLRFESPAAQRQYQGFLAEIKSARADQFVARDSLAEILKQPVAR